MRILGQPCGFYLLTRRNATDKHIFSPWTKCNDNVFVNSDVLEVFIAPVKRPTDVPSVYHEIDTGAAGALWAACINNPAGNVTTQTCEPPQKGTLNCRGAADFEKGLTVAVTNSTGTPGSGWWATDLTVPWAIFAPVRALPGI